MRQRKPLAGLFDMINQVVAQQQAAAAAAAAYAASPEGQAAAAAQAAAAEAARVAAEQAAAAEAARIAAWNAVPQIEWAPDYSQFIDRRRFPDAVWFPGAEGGGSEGGPGLPAGFRVARCGDEGCSYTYVGMWQRYDADFNNQYDNKINSWQQLRDFGLWNLTDPNSVTWNHLQYRAGGIDPRLDTQAFGKAILSFDITGNKGDTERLKANVREMLAGLNPQFIEAMANAIADFYVRYWASLDAGSSGFFPQFFNGFVQFAGELLQLPPIRAMLAAISFGGSEIYVAGAEAGAELLAEEVASDLILQEIATEAALEVAVPEIALELAPEIVAEVVPALEPEMFDFEFFDIADVDFASELDLADFADVDFGSGEIGFENIYDIAPQPEGFLDNWDLLPDETIVYQEPEILNLPIDAGGISATDVFRAVQQGTGVIRSFLPLFQDGAPATAGASRSGTTGAPRTLPRELPALPGARTVTLPTGSEVIGRAPAAPAGNDLFRYGLLALAAFATLKGVG